MWAIVLHDKKLTVLRFMRSNDNWEHRTDEVTGVTAADVGGVPASDSASEDSGLLRLRHREFVADPSEPFKNDVLEREPQVKAFCAVLAGIEAPAVLSLDAGWVRGTRL